MIVLKPEELKVIQVMIGDNEGGLPGRFVFYETTLSSVKRNKGTTFILSKQGQALSLNPKQVEAIKRIDFDTIMM